MLIGVVGLGYVGLPLLDLLATKFEVLGFDTYEDKINQLLSGVSYTEDVITPPKAIYTNDPTALKNCDVLFVCVPTPTIGDTPDRRYLEAASLTIANNMKPGVVICFESTVAPGTSAYCSRLIASASNKTEGIDFHVVYSPERIDPGNKVQTVRQIKKLIGGASEHGIETIAKIYSEVIAAGVHRCPSKEVAEMAKLFENVQRAVNITLSTELALLCQKLNLDVHDVLDACATKWNFMNVRPGKLQGACLPTNLRYLSDLSEHSMPIVEAAIKTDNSLASYIGYKIYSTLHDPYGADKDAMFALELQGRTIAFLGVSYKENIGDTRNTFVPEIVQHLHGAWCYFHDSHASANQFEAEYGYPLIKEFEDLPGDLDAIVIAVKHQEYKELGLERIARKLKPGGWIFDIKKLFSQEECLSLGVFHWSL